MVTTCSSDRSSVPFLTLMMSSVLMSAFHQFLLWYGTNKYGRQKV